MINFNGRYRSNFNRVNFVTNIKNEYMLRLYKILAPSMDIFRINVY